MKHKIASEDELGAQLAADSDGSLAHQLVFDLSSDARQWFELATRAHTDRDWRQAQSIALAYSAAAHVIESLAPALRRGESRC